MGVMRRIHLLLALAAFASAQEPLELADDVAGDDYTSQLSAVRGFERLGARGAPAVPRLVMLLGAPGETAEMAAKSLGYIGAPAVDALRKQTEAKPARIRALAATALGGVGPDAAPAVGDLIRLLRDEDADVRLAAAGALGRIGPGAASALDALLALRKDPDDRVLNQAACSLGRIGSDLDRIVPVLLNTLRPGLLTPPYEGAREGLTALGPRAVPYLLKEIAKAEKEPEYWSALVRLLAGHGEALPALMRILVEQDAGSDDMDIALRDEFAVIYALVAFGEVAAAQVAQLLDKDTALKLKALDVLERLGREAHPARGPIVKAASDPQPAVRRKTVHCLDNLGEVDVLLRMLESDADYEVRMIVCVALGGGARDVRTARALVKATEDKRLRADALTALGSLGVKTPEVAAAVVRGLADEDENVKVGALNAAERLALSEAVEGLLGLLKSDDMPMRLHAARALGAIGRAARPALPALEDFRRTTDDKGAREVREIIESIRDGRREE